MSDIKAVALYEGTFSIGTDKIFRRIAKDDPPHKRSLKLSINPFLIDDGEHKILFDTGLGDLHGGDTTIETILTNLENESVSDYEITDIVLSHLHFDHFGGLANRENGYWELTFPKAKIHVSEKGWKKLYALLDKHMEEQQDFIHFVDSHGDINFLSPDDKPLKYVSTELIGGHTEFHQALFYENKSTKLLMAGDVIGTKGSINRSYAAKFDYNPKEGMQQRNRLQKLAHDENFAIMAYHETYHPIFKLADYDEKKGYKFQNIG